MKKVKGILKKHWFIIGILVISLARLFFTYKLPSFYLYMLNYDDGLMTEQAVNLYGHVIQVKTDNGSLGNVNYKVKLNCIQAN